MTYLDHRGRAARGTSHHTPDSTTATSTTRDTSPAPTTSAYAFWPALAALLLSTLTACGGSASSPEPTVSDCPVAEVKDDTATVALLGRVSAVSPYQRDVDLVITESAASGARVIVSGIDETSEAPSLLADVVLVGEGHNDLERDRNLACNEDAVLDAVASLDDDKTSSTSPDTDADGRALSTSTQNVFDALTTLEGNLSSNPSSKPVDVVLLSPLTSTGGVQSDPTRAVDLSDPETLANPVDAVNRLATQGLMPACDGWRVYAVSPTTGLGDLQAAKLKTFWLTYIDACGGTLVAWTSHLTDFPATDAVPATDTSLLDVDESDPTTTIASISADALFEPDTAVLVPTSIPTLRELLDLAATGTGAIELVGHTNPTGVTSPTATGAAVALSRTRAKAVENWLVDNGIAANRITVSGRGDEDPVNPHPASDLEAAANRRVVAFIEK